MNNKKINRIKHASYLLPDPGGEVVRELLEEIVRLKSPEETSQQGTSSYRLNKLGEWAVEHIGHNPLSAQGFESTILEEFERLQTEVSNKNDELMHLYQELEQLKKKQL